MNVQVRRWMKASGIAIVSPTVEDRIGAHAGKQLSVRVDFELILTQEEIENTSERGRRCWTCRLRPVVVGSDRRGEGMVVTKQDERKNEEDEETAE